MARPKNATTIAAGTATNKTVTNPYNEAYNTYRTNMNKAKSAELGQLNTEYNNQKTQIEGNYGNLTRNAYVSYMNNNRANMIAQSNAGISNNGAAENMNTATATDYNRSIGNAGSYKMTQLSNAENSYNSSVADVNSRYAQDLAKARNEYNQMRIQQGFEARENAKNRRQTARLAEKEFRATRQGNRFSVFQNTIAGFRTVKQINSTINRMKKAKKNGTLKGWERAYYTEIMYTLKARRTTLKKKGKK